MVIAETAKQYYHRGQRPRLYFYRDRSGNEVDLIVENGRDLALFEIKSGQTVNPGFFNGLDQLSKTLPDQIKGGMVIYGGDQKQLRSNWHVWPVKDLHQIHDQTVSFFKKMPEQLSRHDIYVNSSVVENYPISQPAVPGSAHAEKTGTPLKKC